MFTPFPSLTGGLLIGLASAALLLGYGRVAGISGIVGDALASRPGEGAWRLLFLVGLVGGGLAMAALLPGAFPHQFTTGGGGPAPGLVAAGLLVGFGARLGSGCTSGHGVCGLGALSWRSLAATATFMATGALTVFVMRHVVVGGGAS